MFVLLKPRTRNTKSEYYGTLDAVVTETSGVYANTGESYRNNCWMPFTTFDEAFAYLRDELHGDCRYFIFEWVGTEYGRLPEVTPKE